jgi:hypothetical protein
VSTHDTGFAIDDPPALGDDRLKWLYRYWRELAQAAGGMPSLQSFDPLNLPRMLSSLWIVEVAPDTHRFRMRLAGEDINAIYGRNVGGHYFADLFQAADLPTIVARYTRALHEPAVFHATGAIYAAAGRMVEGERLALPMLGRSGKTDTMLGATVYGGRVDRETPWRVTHDVAHFHPFRAARHQPTEIAGA